MDDPWDWDVDRVVQELCSSQRSWYPSTPLKLPPLDQLEKALRGHEVDGEVLMTYEQAELCAELGIKILKHKSTFRNALRELQSRSNRYRLYRKRQVSEFRNDLEDVGDRDQPQGVIEDNVGDLGANFQAPGLGRPGNLSDSKSTTSNSTSSHATPETSERTYKKRKIIPTLVTTQIDPDRNRIIATEADTLRFRSGLAEKSPEEPADYVSDALIAGAYLGPKSISRFDIVDLNFVGHSEPLSEEDKEINFVSTGRLIPGRLIQTHRLVKRRLLRRVGYRRSGFLKSDIVRGSNNPDHDEILPPYGESDDDMAYDSDTWREIEAERQERDRNKQPSKGLTADQIDSTFERVLAQMASDWKAKKLPKCAVRARGIWNEARRSGLKASIDKARLDLHDLEARIAKWKQTIEKNEYRNVAELEHSLSSFEPSVFDREHRSWLIGVLTSPSEPAKISQPRQQKQRRSKPRPALTDEEVLTSDSDDGLQDFIVDDEGESPPVVDDRIITGAGEEYHVEPPHYDDDVVMGSGSESDDATHEEHAEVPSKGQSMLSEPMGNPTQSDPQGVSGVCPQTPQNPRKRVIIDLTTSPDHHSPAKSITGGKSGSKKAPIRAKENVAHSSLIMDIADLTSAGQKVATELMISDQIYVNLIFSLAHSVSPEDALLDYVFPALDREWPKAPFDSSIKRDDLISYHLVRLFETYQDDKVHKLKRYKHLDDKGKQRLRELYASYSEEWTNFINFLKRLSDRFEWTFVEMRKKKKQDSIVASNSNAKEEESRMGNDSLSDDMDIASDAEDNVNDDEQKHGKKKKKRKRKEVVRDREAAMAREVDHAGAAEREQRRKLLRERLLAEGNSALGSQQGSIIVNESKNDDQGFIYINDVIAHRIKEHQVTGVRFMWDQLLVADKRQGCLLAHTMGLGKTMQVITLLLTINQAVTSNDPTVSSQVPEELRESRTLVLCPATLVNNWLDEVLGWLPDNHQLGEVAKVDAMMSSHARIHQIQSWGSKGGVLIIGYNLFKSIVEDGGDLGKTLLQWPNIVVADEAHIMKNPKSKTHVAAATFRTLSRIALTGSPLANNVEEYFSMINWVAPNYLGDFREFRCQYSGPIYKGLSVNSTSSERRHAFRMLRVLKGEVAPKVSRITIRALKHDMPIKKEFVITVPLTPVQRQAYQMYIQYHHSDSGVSKVPVFAVHDLNLICSSPSIFLEKLKLAKAEASNRSETVCLPQQLISNEMALLRSAERSAKDDLSLSWKVPILLEIVGQCKKLNDKVLLFSHSVVTLDYLEGVFRMKKFSIVRLDGQTQMAERQIIINRFNKGNIDVFLISTKAGGLGLNITGANRVVLFDAHFNPQNEQQAVGRAYRLGQKKQVFVYRFVSGGTCEQKVLNQAVWKMQLASRVVDKKHPIPKAEYINNMWDMPEEPPQELLDQHKGKDKVIDELIGQSKYREGIRAIQMMDVFEEEALEDAELSAEDVALADRMILENEARRTGQPLPTQPAPHPSASMSHDDPDPRQSGAVLNSQSSQNPLPGTQIAPTSRFLSRSAGPGSRFIYNGLGLPSRQRHSGPTQHLTPLQLKGTEVHTRPLIDSPNWTGIPDTNTLQRMQEFLTEAFRTGANFPDDRTKARVAQEIATLLWECIENEPQKHRTFVETIKQVASQERFIEALCMGLISPQNLVQMSPELVLEQGIRWQCVDALEWQAQKLFWYSKRTVGDPEHLQTALQRISTAPTQNEHGEPHDPDQGKSFRLDDQKALQAVFDRRNGMKAQQSKEQGVPQTSMETKRAKEIPSGREPRLPDWARNVVRQAQISPPLSAVPPRLPPSPTFSPRPQPKTPFK